MKNTIINRKSMLALIIVVMSLVLFTIPVLASSPSQSQLQVYYKVRSVGTEINYSFYVFNGGSQAFDLAQLKLRYWYTRDTLTEQVARYCTNEVYNHLIAKFITVPGYTNADNYFEVDFSKYASIGGTMLQPGTKSCVMDILIKKNNDAFNQTNDFSFLYNQQSTQNFVYNSRITGYVNNTLILGNEPDFAVGQNIVSLLFSQENFGGHTIGLPVGRYTTYDLSRLGMNDNQINSILVKYGYKVTLYENDNFTGRYIIRTVNDPSFVNNYFGNIISSVIIEIDNSNGYNSTNPENGPTYTPTPIVTWNPWPTYAPTPIVTWYPQPSPVVTWYVTPYPTYYPGGIVSDLGVSVSTDKMKYMDGQIIEYVIDYKNKYNINTGRVTIRGQIPPFTTILDPQGGTVNGNTIEWNFPSLSPLYLGRIGYKVKVGTLDRPEVYADNTVSIAALDDTLENTQDDNSAIKVLLYSSTQNGGYHSLYVVGYPDKLFRPENNITRAEVATIFARISGINAPSQTGGIFSDVAQSHWASGFIDASTRQLGYFKGYPDGSFHPDSPVTRAEVAVVATKYLKSESPSPIVVHFGDSTNHWAKNFIEEAFRYKLIAGYEDGSFRPDQYIKRTEFVTMVNKMLYRGPLTPRVPTFPDVWASHWAFGQVEEAATNHNFYRDANGNEIQRN